MIDPSDPRAPHYWRHETGPELRPAVEAFINNQPMTTRQIYLMREYLRQWIMSPVWDENPFASIYPEGAAGLARLRQGIDALANVKAIRKWLRRALDEGHDPL